MTRDVICGMEISETDAEYQTQYAGQRYYFCSRECKEEFETNPEEFVATAA